MCHHPPQHAAAPASMPRSSAMLARHSWLCHDNAFDAGHHVWRQHGQHRQCPQILLNLQEKGRVSTGSLLAHLRHQNRDVHGGGGGNNMSLTLLLLVLLPDSAPPAAHPAGTYHTIGLPAPVAPRPCLPATPWLPL